MDSEDALSRISIRRVTITLSILSGLFTVLGIMFESRLPNFTSAPYDPRISEGYIGLLVSRAEGRIDAAERAMRDAGAVDIVSQQPETKR